MGEFRYRDKAEQVAEYLQGELLRGRWSGELPGRHALAAELGVDGKSVEEAVRLLVGRGLLVSQGPGRRRRVAPRKGKAVAGGMLVRILPYDQDVRSERGTLRLLDELHQAGFKVAFCPKSLLDLGMDVKRVARCVRGNPADAWIVDAGAREVLQWFAGQPVPALALYGRFTGVPIAAVSPRMAPAMVVAVRRLVALGHRRIVMLVRKERREPFPALFEQIFLKELEALGLPAGRYNLPHWEDHADGLRECIDSLFDHAPPTALFCGEPRLFVAVQQHLARKGILAPEHVSLICSDPIQSFSWCQPAISHFHWDPGPVMRQVVRWAQQVARGKPSRRQVLFDGGFVEGGTIGPVAPSAF